MKEMFISYCLSQKKCKYFYTQSTVFYDRFQVRGIPDGRDQEIEQLVRIFGDKQYNIVNLFPTTAVIRHHRLRSYDVAMRKK
jgi:hypothetical protein